MTLQTWESVVSVPYFADGTALANSVALTDISPGGATTNPSTLPPNSLDVPGQRLRILASGRFSTTGTPTLLLGVYWGGVAGVALATTGALTTPSGATNLTWWLEVILQLRATGTAGSILATGLAAGVAGAGAVSLIPASAPAAVAIDTTTQKALTLGAQWGTASASNTITCHDFLIESTV